MRPFSKGRKAKYWTTFDLNSSGVFFPAFHICHNLDPKRNLGATAGNIATPNFLEHVSSLARLGSYATGSLTYAESKVPYDDT